MWQIISDQWIQTAGHCVYEGLSTDPDPKVGIFKSKIFDLNGRDFRILIPQDWKVVLGEFDDTKEDGWEETYDVSFILTAMMSD